MKVFLCVCVSAVFISIVYGQSDSDNDTLCGGVPDYDLCKQEWNCNSKTSRCFCKSSIAYCRCNNYIDEFYVDTSCTQKWNLLTFALVASLPGVTLALVVGVTVHLIHSCRKPSKSSRKKQSQPRASTEENMFPGIVFASDVTAHPKGPALRSVQGGIPMAAIASRPYSTSGNMDPVSDRPPSGQRRQPYTYSMTDAVRPVGIEGPLNMPVLGGPQRPYSYTADSGQVLSNPYAKARNPYEDPQPSDRYCHQASFPHAHHGNRTSQFSAFHNAPDYTNSSSAFPRAQLGGI